MEWDKFPLEGEWWLPEAPNKVVAGRLEYSEERGALLSLFGAFSDQPGDPRSARYPVILGRTYGTPKVTLFNCSGSRGHSSSPSGTIVMESCRASQILLGHHYANEGEVQFSEISSDFTYLNLWGDLRTIEESRTVDASLIQVHKPIVRELFKADGYSLSLWAYAANRSDFYSVNVSQTTRLVFSFDKPTPLSTYWPLMRDAQNLLTLLVGEPTAPSDFSGFLSGEPPISVKIKRRFAFQGPQKKLLYQELLLPLDKMGDQATDLIRTWMQKAEPLRPIHNVALATVYNDSLYTEGRFLAIAQGLESYHRKVKGGPVLSEVEHEARVKAILDSSPDAHKSWLKRRLKKSNEPHFEWRLQSLGSQFPKFTALLNQRTPEFFTQVATTRNYLTHFDEKNKEGSFPANKLFFPSEKLRALFWMCMLTDMGYPNDKAESIVMSSSPFYSIIHFN